ncbi:glycogen/starch/alpha-glucan phosphorylase [Pleurocapsales cyanobacterium LEGE 10410]|nr:glycogen/starch/alpha-glucan phosphorylase [Pleurocapsales cyanobacterium LEGE 10410]
MYSSQFQENGRQIGSSSEPELKSQQAGTVRVEVEDDRTGTSLETLKRAFTDNLLYTQGKYESIAALHDYYMALAYTVRDRLIQRRIQTVKTHIEQDVKTVYYLSLEFLLGRQLGKNLLNLGLYDSTSQALTELGIDLEELIEQEAEPGLGNGGLGRLAACFLDSLATLEIPARGYGIRYDFGIFHQAIHRGWQIESPDLWLRLGNPWEIPRPEYRVEVKFGGHTEAYLDTNGYYRVQWLSGQTVFGTPYDLLTPGYENNTVNSLRLWSAKASEEFNFQVFNVGDYNRAVADKIFSENISKVLYPNDNTPQGRELRLQQQYFFVACTLHDIIRLFLRNHDNFDCFAEKVAIQLNDTHPTLGIVELMRLLVDKYLLEWESAWEITRNTFAYTNHTLLSEALECWSVDLFGRLLPRHLEIIYEINHRFLERVKQKYPHDLARLRRLSLIEEQSEKSVRMAHLACVGSHSVNGVAQLHTKLLKQDLLRDFAELCPQKFNNKTNGVTPRRWLLLTNQRLVELISEQLGQNWIRDLEGLRQLENLVGHSSFCDRWHQIKQDNKQELADYILRHNKIKLNLDSLFDVQVKRIHEYKRQLLNVLYIITLYNQIKANPRLEIVPRTFIFGGKAAPGYYLAKLIIKLIHSVADVVNNDPDVGDRLKVVFLANYNVSLGEKVYPAAELSEQISTAGKEASGTGNMKFALNGAITIGTLDGANIEIRQAVGEENFFLFGLTADRVTQLKARGYNPRYYYDTNPSLRQAIAQITSGYFSPDDLDLFRPLTDSLMYRDEYLVFADYQAYVDCQERVSQAYLDRKQWTRMSILNVARTGKFSSDRTISEYATEIWNVKPVPVELENYSQESANLKIKKLTN